MLHKGANPSCPSAFRSLRNGKLFLRKQTMRPK